jgi:hypothetical protein
MGFNSAFKGLNSGASNPEPEVVLILLSPDETNFGENDKEAYQEYHRT